jgi:pyruvate dehydrogenase E2 component (dihydrolipoamide acetyltransferase)
MPNLGHTMEVGTVSGWLKAVGDTVRQSEVIAIVESDKACFDVESPADGVLIAIQADCGVVVPVGATIGVVGAPGEVFVAHPAPPTGRTSAQDAATSLPIPDARSSALPTGRSGRVKISPAARALAEELGVDPAAIVATGDDCMVTRDDVRAHAKAHTATRAKPLSPMRRAIAEATQRAWQSIPHVTLHAHADVGDLMKGGGVSLTAAVASACALALCEHRAFNGWLVDQAFEPSPTVNLSLAVATPDGLVAAVVPQAETKTLTELDEEIQALAESARTGRLDGARMLGGSFTISSLGRWGVDAFGPIISAPQVAILGVGRVDRVAREAPGGGVRFASEMQLTLVFDHRANDGVEAAQLLAAIIGYLEHPQRLEVKA